MRVFTVQLVFLFFVSMSALAEEQAYRLEFSAGVTYHKDRTLNVKQDGYPNISFKAEFDSKPFERPIYYSLRFGRWRKNTAWEFEYIHDKLYVDDTPGEIQRFEISHGFNVFLLNRSWQIKDIIYRLGAGTIVSHPDMKIRGQSSENGEWYQGYHVDGVALQGAIQKRFTVTRKTFLSLEAKLIYADTDVPIPDGSVHIIYESAHFLLGYGGEF